jgi:phosphoglycerol transferase MdoB-like AlkP superfamily enzyme
MRLTLTFTVAAIGSLLFGLAYLLVPASLLLLYGLAPDPSSQWIARYFGSALLGFAVMFWLARKVPSGPALRAILVSAFIVSVTGLGVAILQLRLGPGNTLVWSTALIYFLLSLGFGDFVFRTPPPG